MTQTENLAIAEAWVAFSNQQDLNNLQAVTAEPLELIGPRGAGLINRQELAEWMVRANLTLATNARYAKDEFVVFQQEGTWFNTDGSIKGQATVFTVLKIINGKVSFLARYDQQAEAFAISGLSAADQV